jgi:hypothetical protein
MTAPAFRATRGDSLTWSLTIAEDLTGWTPKWSLKAQDNWPDTLDTGALITAIVGSGLTVTTPLPVTFTDTGDLVGLALMAPGIPDPLADGDLIEFAAITTTTGIAINTPYYVVGRTLTTFQVASTLGGAALPLTLDGTGTLKRARIALSVAATATAALAPGVFVWDLQLVSGANVRTIEWDDDGINYGTLTIKPDVTRLTT